MTENPYGQNPQQPPQPPENPYGTGPGESPYGQPSTPQPAPPPYGQQPYPDQSGQAPAQQNPYAQNPYGAAPYAQQPPAGPLGDGLDMYGRPLERKATDDRPGTVTAAGWVTLVFSGLTFLLFGFILVAMFIAKDDVITEIDKQIRESGGASDFDANDAYGLVVGILLVVTIWTLIACVLAVFAMRRSNISRILLVISSVVAGLLCLLGISSVVSAVPLLACIAVIVLLFTGGANQWFRST